jgi:hypothetical protein
MWVKEKVSAGRLSEQSCRYVGPEDPGTPKRQTHQIAPSFISVGVAKAENKPLKTNRCIPVVLSFKQKLH